MNNYTDTLRAHNLKATPQRLEITNVLYVQGHATIETLYETMIKKFNSVSLATIYKNVNLMMENAFIQEVKIPRSKSVYELTKESHSHMVCSDCGEVQDVSVDLDAIVNQVSKETAFNVDSTNLVLSGKCQNCH